MFDVLEAAAADVPEVESAATPDGSLGWSRAGQLFAVLSPDGTAVEYALDPAVAAAAARTPDTVVSGRGAGWVRFSPAVLDGHGVDRAVAWFLSAHRRLERS